MKKTVIVLDIWVYYVEITCPISKKLFMNLLIL